MSHPALGGASTTPYWLDTPSRPEERPALGADTRCSLLVVGGGYSGLWTALLAKEREPDRDVVLIEGERIGWAASGRNGGFCDASLTHGRDNAVARFPGEVELLDRLGRENLDEIEATIARYGIECAFTRSGAITVATKPFQVEELRGRPGAFLGRTDVRARLDSPTFLAGEFDDDVAMLDPARLAWGLAAAAERAGVRIYDRTLAVTLTGAADGVRVRTGNGHVVHADYVALGTNAFPSLLRRLRLYTVPVYDYALMSEPLTAEQWSAIGWTGGEGFSDMDNQFHYYRRTEDGRILWGGYDAIYHFGRRVNDRRDQRARTFDRLAEHFFETFPQLDGLRFTHAWGGAIDTSTRFCAFFGTALKGRVAYALGYTGLGVGATRFGANVMLDLLDGLTTERTSLALVRRKPMPFPPEPFAYIGIQATRWSMARADRHDGRRNLWLRALDRLGLGFDS